MWDVLPHFIFNIIMNIPFFRKPNVTQKFIDKFCYADYTFRYTTRDEDIIENDWQTMHQALQNSDINLDIIANHLKKQYENKVFYLTPYWQICRNKVAKNNKFCCQLNYRHDNSKLEVHHPTYVFLGYEAQNLDRLIPLCKECHQTISDKNVEEKKKKLELQKNNTFKIKNPDILIDLINNQAKLLNQTNSSSFENVKPIVAEIETVSLVSEPETSIENSDPLCHITYAGNVLNS